MPPERVEFVARYGGIYEHSPWVAEACFDTAAEAGVDELAATMADCVDRAARAQKLELIRAHPDLAGKAAVAGDLTVESTEEQAAAGIDRLTPEEFERFTALNDAYRAKFGFPFVMAVRHSDKAAILAAFEARLSHDEATEFETAIAEIHKIARWRLEAMAGQ